MNLTGFSVFVCSCITCSELRIVPKVYHVLFLCNQTVSDIISFGNLLKPIWTLKLCLFADQGS